ncbi:MAG: hypothetical protein K2X81_09500 [Candidatus Obscuribacterales bacterium]|nr:hypothetical protein [Candidatus Obscuribacterales bacterium]
MNHKRISGVLLALIAGVSLISPVFAQQFYNNSYGNGNGYGYGSPYGYPAYNNYNYRGYAPYQEYGYRNNRRSHSVRNALIGAGIGAGIGAAVGLMASHHGHRYD